MGKNCIFILIGCIISLCFATGLKAQDINKDSDSVYNILEKSGVFPGGNQALIEFLSDNIRYPRLAKEKGVSGKVYASFIIEKDGSISNIKIEKDIGDGCAEEVVRIIKLMPKWEPGSNNGKPVRQFFILPVNFTTID